MIIIRNHQAARLEYITASYVNSSSCVSSFAAYQVVHAPEDAYIRSERTHWARIFFQNALGPYSFIVFIFIVLGFGVFFFLKLPETKNKSYDDIYRIFNKDAADPNGKVTATAYWTTSVSSQNGTGG